jgi:hypothetical protein
MLTAREKLEDMKWLEEVLGLMENCMKKYAETSDPQWLKAHEQLEVEANNMRESLKKGDWKVRQAKADAHCKARGCTDKHVCWRYGL